MKKKLLITLGCSHTEGVGCWDDKYSYPIDFDASHRDFGNFLGMNMDNFHELGWPNRLGKKLGYDKVINLGFGGSSTSAQMKMFILRYSDKQFDDYDVSVVWLLTDSLRTSFFRNNILVSLMPSDFYEDNVSLFESIYKFVSKNGTIPRDIVLMDYIREEYVNRKSVETICNLKNWNFISFHSHTHHYNNMIQDVYDSNKNHCFDDIGFTLENDERYISNICGHFNEVGYEMLSNNMYDWILKNHPKMVDDNLSDTIDWEYHGFPEFKHY